MATYAFDVYVDSLGNVKYGPPPGGGASFAISTFTAHEQGYGAVRLDWSTPKSTVTWSRLRIVRSSSGYPTSETDGVTVLEVLPADVRRTTIDSGLVPATYYYYSIYAETDLPTYSSTVTYTRGEVVKDVSGNGYVSLITGNVGNTLATVTAWSPVNTVKRWLLVADTNILATKRFDSTTMLYQALPRAYRDPSDPDWVEPVQPALPDLNYYQTWPVLGRYLSTFGFTLDSIRTYYETLLSITDPEVMPVEYLPVLAQQMGVELNPTMTARLARLRLVNASLLARSRGTAGALVNAINSAFNWDAAVTLGKNLVPNKDTADALNPVYQAWDATTHYVTGDYVYFSSSIGVYRALVDSTGVTPVLNSSNATWAYGTSQALAARTVLYEQESGSQANWAPENRALCTCGVSLGIEDPGLSGSHNTLLVHNDTGTTQTLVVASATNFYAPAWSAGTAFIKGDLTASNSQIWQALADHTGTTPGSDVSRWRLYLDRVPSAIDPSRIYKDGIPVLAGTTYTLSAYMRTNGTGVSSSVLIDWYNDAGVFISTSTGTGSALTANTYARRTVSGTAPALAKYAVMRMSWTSVATAVDGLWKSVMFEASASASTYEPPRLAKVLIKPDRTNYMSNPSAEGTSGTTVIRTNLAVNSSFEAGSGTTVVRTNLFPNPVAVSTGSAVWVAGSGTGGTAAGAYQTGQTGWAGSVATSYRTTWSVANSAVGGGILGSSNVAPVTVGRTYGLLLQVRASKIQRMGLRIDWYNAGAYLSSTGSPHVILAANTVTTMNVVAALAPASATHATFVVEAAVGTSGVVWNPGDWVEASNIQIEETDVTLAIPSTGPLDGLVRGDTAAGTFGADYTYTWVGTANASVSEMRAPAVTLPGLAMAASGGAASQSTEQVLHGTKSMKLWWGTTGAGSAGDGFTPTGLTIGRTYTHSRWVYVPTGSVNITLSVDGIGTTGTFSTKDVWTRISHTIVATATSHNFRIVNQAATVKGGDVCYTDAALIEESNVLLPYFDGTTTADDRTNLVTAPSMEANATLRTNLVPNPSTEAVSATTTVVRTNIFPNPRVAVDASSWNVFAGTGGTAAVTRQTGQTGWGFGLTTSARGTWSVASSAVSGGLWLSTLSGIVVGNTYAGFMQVRCSKIQRMFISLDWYTAADAFISTTQSAQTVLVANTVTNLQVSGVAPATAAKVLVTAYAVVGTSGTVWGIGDWLEATNGHVEETDQFLQTGGGPTVEYNAIHGTFSGATAAATYGTNFTYAWVGTADASASTLLATTVTGSLRTGTGVAVFHSTTERALVGTKSMKVLWGTHGGSVAAVYQNTAVSVVSGKTYTCSIWGYAPTGTSDWACWISGSAQVGSPTPAAVTAKDQWARSSITFTAVATGTISVGVLNRSATTRGGNYCYLDQWLVEESNDPLLPYFDGSTPASGGYTYAWTGTTDASTSTATGPITTVVRTNLVPNSYLANDTFGWGKYDGVSGVTDGGVRVAGSSGYSSGVSTSFRVTWTTATTTVSGGINCGGAFTTYIPVIAGRTYSALIQGKPSKTQRIASWILFYDSAGTQLGAGTQSSHQVLAANQVGTFLVTGVVAPATSVRAVIYLASAVGTSGVVWNVADWIDASRGFLEETDVTLVATVTGNPLTGAFYGSVNAGTGGPDYTYGFAAVAHQSSSEMRAPAATSWAVTSSSTGATLHRSSDRSYRGTYSAMFRMGTGVTNASNAGITVSGLTPGKTYTMSGYLYIPTGSPNVALCANGYGVGTTVTAKDAWSVSTHTFVPTASAVQIIASPRAAAVLGDDVCYIDAVMVEEGSPAQEYFDGNNVPSTGGTVAWAGTAHASVSIHTPVGGGDYTYVWTGAANASTAQQKGPTPTGQSVASGVALTSSSEWAQYGTYSYRLKPANSATVDTYIDLMGSTANGLAAGLPGKTITISAYVYVPAVHIGPFDNIPRTRRIVVNYQAPSVSDGAMQGIMSSVAPNAVGTTRISLTVAIPADVTFLSLRLYSGSSSAGDIIYFDGVLVEQGTAVRDYVDPSLALNTDWIWAGTPNASKSFYYSDYQDKRYLVDGLIVDYVPMGTTWTVTYADQ